MTPLIRIFLLTFYLGCLFLTSTILLLFSAERVGAHRSSTFGKAWSDFEAGWGGEMDVSPPSFDLLDTQQIRVTDSAEGKAVKTPQWETRSRFQALLLRKAILNTDIQYGSQSRNWISFNTFEATSEDTYVVENGTDHPGLIAVSVPQIGKSSLLSHFTMRVNGKPTALENPKAGEKEILPDTLYPGENRIITITWTSKGMDHYRFKISNWMDVVTDSLSATISLNTGAYNIASFGLPHHVKEENGKNVVRFSMDHFASGQDIMLSFHSRSAYLDQVRRILEYSPAAMALMLLVIVIFSQVAQKKFYAIHYLFFAAIILFYFLFLSYTIRFFHVGVSIGISTSAMGLMAFIYFPPVLGRAFFLKKILPFLLLLTLGFSLAFLIPVIQGIAFLVLLFGVFLALMVAFSKSDFKNWPLMEKASEMPQILRENQV